MCFKWWFKLSDRTSFISGFCHCHYLKLSEIVEKFFIKHDIKYNSFDSFSENLNSTIKRLKYLGD